MIQVQQRLLILCKHIHKPFVLRLIALLVSGLIALLLGGALLLSGHGAFVNRLPMQMGRASEGMVVQWPISTSLPAAYRRALTVAPVISG